MSKFGKYMPAAALLAALIIFRSAFEPFLMAAASAYILDMPARGFERLFSGIGRHNVRRPLAVLAALISISALFVLFVALLCATYRRKRRYAL